MTARTKHTLTGRFSMVRKLQASIARFQRDESGLGTLEFATSMLFLLPLWLGFMSLVQLQAVQTKVGKVAATAADIVAQREITTANDVNRALGAARGLMGAGFGAQLQMWVAGVRVDASGNASITWSRDLSQVPGSGAGAHTDNPKPPVGAYNGTGQYTTLSNRDLPPGFHVVSRVYLRYNPGFIAQFIGPREMLHEAVFAPRVSLETTCTNC